MDDDNELLPLGNCLSIGNLNNNNTNFSLFKDSAEGFSILNINIRSINSNFHST